jgi:flagellin-specific chaperone FliS
MLDLGAWEHAGALVSVYDYALRRIIDGNVTKSAAAVAEARRLLAEIGAAFREASGAVLPSTAPVVVADDVRPRLSIQPRVPVTFY